MSVVDVLLNSNPSPPEDADVNAKLDTVMAWQASHQTKDDETAKTVSHIQAQINTWGGGLKVAVLVLTLLAGIATTAMWRTADAFGEIRKDIRGVRESVYELKTDVEVLKHVQEDD